MRDQVCVAGALDERKVSKAIYLRHVQKQTCDLNHCTEGM